MNEPGEMRIHTDGGARGNPGPAAYAYVLVQDGARHIEASGCLGETTNNIAEYTALVRALAHAQQLGARRLVVKSDSELMIKQMRGEYKVRNEGLRPLYEEAKALCDAFASVEFQHVPREQNRRADRLCNEALDRAQPRAAPPTKRSKPPATNAQRRRDASDEAVECLRAVAAAWARGDANEPKPEAVWEQLWSILEDNGVVSTTERRAAQS